VACISQKALCTNAVLASAQTDEEIPLLIPLERELRTHLVGVFFVMKGGMTQGRCV
jgi:hypothetical protein